jgi:hypothetical protein
MQNCEKLRIQNIILEISEGYIMWRANTPGPIPSKIEEYVKAIQQIV